jgi:hypothetical protein
MDIIWKWIMHLNAKAFCLLATLVFFAIAGWCGFKYIAPPQPFQDSGATPPAPPQPYELGTLNIVSNQLADELLAIPSDPFRPTLEAIFTNETERVAFIKALKEAQARAAGLIPAGADDKKGADPFEHLRKKTNVPDGQLGPNGQPMVVPKLSFLGFVQRPDGSKAAAFYDSVANTTVFYDSGNKVHGVDIVDANVREAEIRFPDGSTRKLEIGGSIELAPEPDTRPKPAAKPAANAKEAAANPKQAAANPKQAAANPKPPKPKK